MTKNSGDSLHFFSTYLRQKLRVDAHVGDAGDQSHTSNQSNWLIWVKSLEKVLIAVNDPQHASCRTYPDREYRMRGWMGRGMGCIQCNQMEWYAAIVNALPVWLHIMLATCLFPWTGRRDEKITRRFWTEVRFEVWCAMYFRTVNHRCGWWQLNNGRMVKHCFDDIEKQN